MNYKNINIKIREVLYEVESITYQSQGLQLLGHITQHSIGVDKHIGRRCAQVKG